MTEVLCVIAGVVMGFLLAVSAFDDVQYDNCAKTGAFTAKGVRFVCHAERLP